MEGPTPVSALIHAATLVTAGVYLMLRSAPLLEQAPITLITIAWIGAATSLYAAVTGLLVNDLKRVIAFSTCSQLGYMMMAIGLSQYHVGLYHLVAHASFKACLFMGAGSVIHAMGDMQDMRRLGALSSLLPFTYVCMLVSSLSLMALPGLAGYYSKDHLLELAYGSYTINGYMVYYAGTLAAACTAFYSTRLIMLVFFMAPRSNRQMYKGVHEAPMLMAVPMAILCLLAILFGYVMKDLWLGMGTDFLSAQMHINPQSIVLVEAEFCMSPMAKLLPLMVSLLGALAAVVLYGFKPFVLFSFKQSSLGQKLYGFINAQWRFNALITNLVISPSLAMGHYISKVLDRGAVELMGPYGIGQALVSTGNRIASYDTSIVTSYALYIVIGFVFMALMSIVSTTYMVLMLIFGGGIAMLPLIKE
jgi:NADH-ubiquinone oxidoreductase chain 5